MVDELDELRAEYEDRRRKMGESMMNRWDRFFPLDEMLADRWKKAEVLGFGSESSVYENVYVYGKPKIGEKVWIGPFVMLDASGGLEIGDGCDLSTGVLIYTHTTHVRVLSEGKKEIIHKPVRIGAHTYLGSGAIVLPGVTIGDHCVVGAGSVVTRDIEPYSVAMGLPARTVGRVVVKDGDVELEYFQSSDDVAGETAELISKGLVIGWFQGRMEYGPRALGARSVLADPRDPKMRDRINFMLKQRDWFMPFAPSMKLEAVDEYMVDGIESPFMTMAFKVKDNKIEEIPAVIHVDGTARPQTVRKESNPLYYRMINEFESIAGIPMVLNTSFNKHGLPIVCNVDDAVWHLANNHVEVLAIGNYIVRRKQA